MENTNDKAAVPMPKPVCSIELDQHEEWRVSEFEDQGYPVFREEGLEAYAKAVGDARAEEARREAAAEIADLNERLAREVLLSTEAAQRTAGGDDLVMALKPGYEGGTMVNEDLGGKITLHYQSAAEADAAFSALCNALDGQPVAEAAAQADDCPKCKGTGEQDSGGVTPWGEGINIPCDCAAPTAAQADESGACMFDVVDDLRRLASSPIYSPNECADTMRQAANTIESLRALFFNYAGIVADKPAAAPTAQPTQAAAQNEANRPQTRMNTGSDALFAAQPTPPDDQRARFEAAVRRITCADDSSFQRDAAAPDDYDDMVMSNYWNIWRAALRQPGALPEWEPDNGFGVWDRRLTPTTLRRSFVSPVPAAAPVGARVDDERMPDYENETDKMDVSMVNVTFVGGNPVQYKDGRPVSMSIKGWTCYAPGALPGDALLKAIRKEIDHCVMNDKRLTPEPSGKPGDHAVPVAYLEAAIEAAAKQAGKEQP